MYGVVNGIFRQVLIEDYGDDAWKKISKGVSSISEESYCMNQCPDEVTYEIVQTASEILDVPMELLLNHLGKRWVDITSQGEFKDYYNIGGKSMFAFLANLNHLHASLGKTFTHLSPPAFEIENQNDDSMELVYISHRPGLTPFVKGLLQGLSYYFKQSTVIEHLPEKSEDNRQIFSITVNS